MKQKPAPKAKALRAPQEIAAPEDFELDEGIITSGLCATPEAQTRFDVHEAGRPPQDADAPESPPA